jgi:hypothetical protein
MAVDTTDKALNLCTRLADAANRLMIAVEDLANLKDEKESAGLTLTAAEIEAALDASSLKHADGTDFDNVISSGAAVKTFLVTNFHDDIFAKVRP